MTFSRRKATLNDPSARLSWVRVCIHSNVANLRRRLGLRFSLSIQICCARPSWSCLCQTLILILGFCMVLWCGDADHALCVLGSLETRMGCRSRDVHGQDNVLWLFVGNCQLSSSLWHLLHDSSRSLRALGLGSDVISRTSECTSQLGLVDVWEIVDVRA